MTFIKGKISRQAWMAAPETVKVMQALFSDGGEARFVGGCVRNALVNRKVLDIDIATPLKPDEVIARLVSHKINYAPTGLKHGTITAVCDGRPYEITTLRKDVLTFGRHAEVAFTDDWATDASRRDFTINAMFATMDGDIDDPFGGIADLREGRVIFVGDPEKRIKEDILRILRFFRFYAHFGKGPPDEKALAACTLLAKEIPKLSPERIRQETMKIFESENCAAVWRIMLTQGIVTHFLPEATGIAVLEKLLWLEQKYESPAYPLRRLAAVMDVTEAGLPHVCAALRLSNAQGTQLQKMIAGDDSISMYMDHADVRRLVYHHGNDMARSLLLLAAAKQEDEGDLAVLYNWATTFRPPRFPLEGNDLMELGWEEGPDIGFILGTMEAWWLSEDFAPGRMKCLEKLKAEYTPKTKP